jgi:hypothetical protein
MFRVERKRGPVWYAKYRLPDARQLQRKIGPAWAERGRPDPLIQYQAAANRVRSDGHTNGRRSPRRWMIAREARQASPHSRPQPHDEADHCREDKPEDDRYGNA